MESKSARKEVTLDRAAWEDLKDGANEATKLRQRVAELERQLASARAAEASASVLPGLVTTSEAAFRLLNRDALELPSGAHDLAPSGLEPELREHANYRMALERVLDGLDRALNGMTTAKGRALPGVVQNMAYWEGRLALTLADKGTLFTDRGVPLPEARTPYEAYVSMAELKAELEAVRGYFLQAFEQVVLPGTEYAPFEARMEAHREKQAKAEKNAEATREQMAAMLSKAKGLKDLLKA